MRWLVRICVFALALGALAPTAGAGVNVERQGAENPVLEVAKSTVYGGLAGLVLGSAVALVDDGHDDGDIIKWGFAGGTFLGFGAGCYFVLRRPSATALFELEDGRVHLALAAPRLARAGGLELPLVGLRF